MTMDPMQRFIGVKGNSPPWELLDLPQAKSSIEQIDAALRKRLSQVEAHPEGLNEEASEVRKQLREAASLLTKVAKFGVGIVDSKIAQRPQPQTVSKLPSRNTPGWMPRSGARPSSSELTMFDRQVMAVLVGCGGWNFASRAKLVALAAGNGLSVQGLVRVVTGLSEYAKSGGPRLGVEEITSGQGRIESSLVAASMDIQEPIAYIPPSNQLLEDHTWTKIKLSFLFGTITLIVMLVIARVALFPSKDTTTDNIKSQLPVVDTSLTDEANAIPNPDTSSRRIANFQQIPTFLGESVPTAAAEALNECAEFPDELDLIARKIIIAKEPSLTVYRDWKEIIETIGDAWLLLDARMQEDLDSAILEVFYAAADKPSVSDELLSALTPNTKRFYEPIEIWRGMWMVLTLQKISERKDLAPAVVDQARLQLDVAIEDQFHVTQTGNSSSAQLWLDQAAHKLVDVLEFEADIYNYWECWLRAQRYLAQGERLNSALLRTVTVIMQTSTDLSNPGPSINVLGRLLSMADFRASNMVKQSVKALFDDPDNIGNDDLWVLTSLLAQSQIASWFSEDLVLAYDADWVRRRRTADRIMLRWPDEADKVVDFADAVGGLSVDATLGPRWIALVEQILSDPLPNRRKGLMKQLLISSWLNEAAARLVASKTIVARELIYRTESAIASPNSDVLARPKFSRRDSLPGQAIGNDAMWAVTFEQEGRNTPQKLKLLRMLRDDAGTDLGPIDAEVFVNIIYRGSPQEVRAFAGSVLVEQFSNGPNVALELLDQFPGVTSSGVLSDAITRLTGQLLGPVRSTSWKSEARLALVEHCLRLQVVGNSQINLLSELISESYINRTASLKGHLRPIAGANSPTDAAQQLAQAWRDRAISAIVSDPVPGDLSSIGRRAISRLSLAQGTLQQFVAQQLAVLDLLVYITSAEQPELAERLRSLLASATVRRSGINKVLNQATDIERTIMEVWSLRLDVSTTGGGRQ
ncbi:MAG: hypothetical protein IH984_12320 [Planctomycetes bacterium]|nr:hypothetical protein [Planctomycetota bacterium]